MIGLTESVPDRISALDITADHSRELPYCDTLPHEKENAYGKGVKKK